MEMLANRQAPFVRAALIAALAACAPSGANGSPPSEPPAQPPPAPQVPPQPPSAPQPAPQPSDPQPSATPASQPGPPAPGAPQQPPKKEVIPADASEGPRDLAVLPATLKSFVADQPYGKHWKQLVAKTPPPADRRDLGDAKTHPDLANDPIEAQEQVQYLQDTDTQLRFGRVSIRGVRAFRYGKLAGAHIVLERIGRSPESAEVFAKDLEALRAAWKDPFATFGLEPARWDLKRNELSDPAAKTPIRIVFEPKQAKQGPAAPKKGGG